MFEKEIVVISIAESIFTKSILFCKNKQINAVVINIK